MIRRLMVANRAEIASRVFRTCRRLGISTVAIHSDADAGLPYVREADVAVRLPGNTPAETYLDVAVVLAAAKAAGADAIHPGYGFLSENADFARAVIGAGLTWVGPSPESIDAMGSKIGAKELMRKAGVPTLEAPEHPTEADLPLLVKASAGGGGRGMRIVRALADLDREIAAAQAEAQSAFGDGTVFVEPYVEHGRHVEVQVVGTSVYGDRDCSVQRRHQKVVEEAPAPGLSDEVRAALHDAARKAAEAIDYRGAGTVEFLYDPATERFWFLEMNTRLQVEHPVTELVHDVDLVKLQIDAAENDWTMGGPTRRAAMRSRCACRRGPGGRLPATERHPHAVRHPRRARHPGGLRLRDRERGVDPLRRRCWPRSSPMRQPASRPRAKLAGVLERARIHGLVTNRDLLVQVLRDPAFLAGDVSTAFLVERTFVQSLDDHLASTAAAIAIAEATAEFRTVQRGIPVAWRSVVSQPQVTRFEGDIEVRWWGGRDGYVLEDAAVVSTSSTNVVLESDGVRTSYQVDVGEQVDVDWPAATRRSGVPPGSWTQPTRWRAAACWRRCRAPSSASRSSRASRSRPGSRCSCSRR